MNHRAFLDEHLRLTRRFLLQAGALGAMAPLGTARLRSAEKDAAAPKQNVDPDKAGARGDPYFTPAEDFRDVSRGAPLPHSLPDEKKREVGLTRETWRLEVLSDPEQPARLGAELKLADGSALDFAALVKLGERHAVRFAKVMTCLNLGCP